MLLGSNLNQIPRDNVNLCIKLSRKKINANQRRKHSKIKRFLTLNERIITQNSKDSVIINCHKVQWPALISHCNQSSVIEVD